MQPLQEDTGTAADPSKARTKPETAIQQSSGANSIGCNEKNVPIHIEPIQAGNERSRLPRV